MAKRKRSGGKRKGRSASGRLLKGYTIKSGRVVKVGAKRKRRARRRR